MPNSEFDKEVKPWMVAASEEIRQCCLQQAGYLNAGLTAKIIATHAPHAPLEDEYNQKAVDVIKNLAMLVRRMCHRLNTHEPNSKIVDQALGYLRGEGLQGSILRTPTMHRCGRCGHPADWHRADDSQNIPATSPALKFRCIGYDCEAPGPPVKDGCNCPDFAERLISR